MAYARSGILAVFVQISSVNGLSWAEASSTVWATQTSSSNIASASTSQSAVIATPAPYLSNGNVSYEPSHICGWVDFSSWNSYTCGGQNTCFWNSHLKLVGCGNTASIDYFTSCIPYHELKYCESSCMANPSIIRCAQEVPHCITPRIGPALNYSIHACQATPPHGTNYKVHLEYRGQVTIGHLPRYLGDDGNITYATRTPSLLRSSAGIRSTSSSTVYLESTTESEASTETAGVVATGHRNQSECLAAENAAEVENAKQIVVGSVMGGFMLFILVCSVFGVWLAWRRSVRLREGKGVEFEMLHRDGEAEGVRDGNCVGRVERETP